jgi:hypothetical protein
VHKCVKAGEAPYGACRLKDPQLPVQTPLGASTARALLRGPALLPHPKAHVDAFQGTVPIPRLARRPLITSRMLTSRCRPPCRFGGVSFIGLGVNELLIGRATAGVHLGRKKRIRAAAHARGGRRRSWNQARYLLILSRCAAGA